MPCEKFPKCTSVKKCQGSTVDSECLKTIYQKTPIRDPGQKPTYYFDPLGNEVLLYRIDNHVISQKTDNDSSKCDYMLILSKENEKSTLIFVELKGQDIAQAEGQILSTIEILKKHFHNSQYTYIARIISSKVPKICKISNLEKFKAKLISINGTKGIYVKCKNLVLEEKFTDFYK